ncbi:MAG: hypothetical protein WBE29_09995, partial [Pseudolabrys sp.]
VVVIRKTTPEITIIDRMCIVALSRGEAAALIVSSAFLQLLSNGRIIRHVCNYCELDQRPT